MSSLVDVVNDALSQIGETPIAALDDASVKAQICNTHLPIVLRAMLFDTKWNFAYTRVLLTPDTTTPVSAFPYQYTLPGDYVRVWGIGDDPRLNGAPDYSFDWKIEQGKLLCGIAGPLTVHYTAYIDEPNRWSGGFTIAFATLLASRLAGAIPHDTQLSQAKLQEYYNIHLPNALAGDGQEQSTDAYETPDLLEVRDGNMFYATYGSTGSLVSSGSGSSGGAGTTIIPTGWFDVTLYGAQGSGTVDDTDAILRAIDAAKTAGGGIVYFPRGTYKITQTLYIDASNIHVKGSGTGATTIRMSGNAASFRGIEINGLGSTGNSTTLAVNGVLGDIGVTLNSSIDFAVGDLVYFQATHLTQPLSIFTLITKINYINANVISLENPLPCNIDTASTHLVEKFIAIDNVGIEDLTVDGSDAAGTSVRGIWIDGVKQSVFRNIVVKNTQDAGMNSIHAYRSTFDNITVEDCTDPNNEADFDCIGCTECSISNIHSFNSQGFGPKLTLSSYCSVNGIISVGAMQRGIKFHSARFCTISNLISNNSGLTGIGITESTSHCTFTNIITCTNILRDMTGLWFSDQENQFNLLTNVHSYNNGGYDIAVWTSDTLNMFVNVKARPSKCWNLGGATFTNFVNDTSGAQNLCFAVDHGGGVSPGVLIDRYSDSPAASDVLGALVFRGRNLSAAEVNYADVRAAILDPTAGAEQGQLTLVYSEGATGPTTGIALNAPGSGETALVLRVNVGGSLSLQRVSMGANDSGGGGYKVLRVPN